uniref:Uncharacterized protein n=1 Tax=Schistocephalus solidus TaxID=70667 RepID=A0A0X3NZ27_SCHSO
MQLLRGFLGTRTACNKLRRTSNSWAHKEKPHLSPLFKSILTPDASKGRCWGLGAHSAKAEPGSGNRRTAKRCRYRRIHRRKPRFPTPGGETVQVRRYAQSETTGIRPTGWQPVAQGSFK